MFSYCFYIPAHPCASFLGKDCSRSALWVMHSLLLQRKANKHLSQTQFFSAYLLPVLDLPYFSDIYPKFRTQDIQTALVLNFAGIYGFNSLGSSLSSLTILISSIYLCSNFSLGHVFSAAQTFPKYSLWLQNLDV